jgi:endoribonuclease Dicer
MPLQEYERKGQAFWDAIYPGENNIYDMLYKVYPDLAWFSKTVGYGLVYGHMEILSQLETSYTLVAANIAGDTPQQISWHLAGAKQVGASSEEVKAVRSIVIEVGKHCGVQWKNPVPEIDL